ncbi:38839_t:CDS:2, partial [Gigaspora margarita]
MNKTILRQAAVVFADNTTWIAKNKSQIEQILQQEVQACGGKFKVKERRKMGSIVYKNIVVQKPINKPIGVYKQHMYSAKVGIHLQQRRYKAVVVWEKENSIDIATKRGNSSKINANDTQQSSKKKNRHSKNKAVQNTKRSTNKIAISNKRKAK